MQITTHADARMNQRGIKKAHIALALEHGEADGDKIVLTAQSARQRADELRQELRHLDAIANKGGVTAVICENQIVTTYRTASFSAFKSKKVRH